MIIRIGAPVFVNHLISFDNFGDLRIIEVKADCEGEESSAAFKELVF